MALRERLATFLLAACAVFSACTPALVVKAQNGDLAATRLLLSKPIDQETKDEAFIDAVMARHDDVAELLLDNGANVETKNDFRASALSAAARAGDVAGVKMLLDHKAKMSTAFDALKNAAPAVAIIFLDHGLDPNTGDSNGATPLAHAACSGQTDLVRFWLEHGANPVVAGKACERSHFDVDSVTMVCDGTATALDCAKAKGYSEITALLEAALKK